MACSGQQHPALKQGCKPPNIPVEKQGEEAPLPSHPSRALSPGPQSRSSAVCALQMHGLCFLSVNPRPQAVASASSNTRTISTSGSAVRGRLHCHRKYQGEDQVVRLAKEGDPLHPVRIHLGRAIRACNHKAYLAKPLKISYWPFFSRDYFKAYLKKLLTILHRSFFL